MTELENRAGPAPQLTPSGTHGPSLHLLQHFHILGLVPSGTADAVVAAWGQSVHRMVLGCSQMARAAVRWPD